jgi:6-phosphogluconolactonase
MIHPNGKFLYLSLIPGTGIAVFNIDSASGSLTLSSTSPVVAGADFTSMTIDPSGQFLFTIDTLQETLNTFRIDPSSGSLTAIGTPISVGARALQLQVVKAP